MHPHPLRPAAGFQEHGPKRVTSLHLTFDVEPASLMPEPQDWAPWQAVARKVFSFSGASITVFAPTLAANCPKLAAADAPGVLLSDDQLHALRACLFGRSLRIDCSNAAQLAELAGAAGYSALESAVRGFYGHAATLADKHFAQSRERAEAAYRRKVQDADDACGKATADAHAECQQQVAKAHADCERQVAKAEAKRDSALQTAQRNQQAATLKAEQQRAKKSAFMCQHPL